MASQFTVCLSLLAILMSTGCEKKKGTQDLRRFVDSAFANERPDIEPIPRMRPHETFVYAASGMADPFAITNLRRQPSAVDFGSPDEARRREPLERYPLDALEMIGTMFRDNSRWVIVRAPDNSTHSAKTGNYVGQRSGLITSVSEGEVEVIEQIPDPTGGWMDRTVKISLIQEQ